MSLGSLTIASSGRLDIQTRTPGTQIDLGTYTVNLARLQLAQSAFWNGTAGNFRSGFSAISIGSFAQTGTISINGLNHAGTGDLSLTTIGAVSIGANGLTTANRGVSITGNTYTQAANADIATGSGDITITANSVEINTSNAGSNALQTSGVLTLQTRTPSTAMSLAGTGGSIATFDLNSTEIAYLGNSGASAIVIGRDDATAALTLGGAVDLAGMNLTLRAASIGGTGSLSAADLTLRARDGAVSLTGTVSATGNTTVVATDDVTLNNAANAFIGAVSATGEDVSLRASGDLHLGGSTASGTFTAQAGGDLHLDAGTTITSGNNFDDSNTSNSVVLVAGDEFINHAGASVIRLTAGDADLSRWLVYTNDPYTKNDVLGGLLSHNQAIFDKSYAGYLPSAVTESGNRYVLSMALADIPEYDQYAVKVSIIDSNKTYGDALTLATDNNTSIVFGSGSITFTEFSEPKPGWLDVSGLQLSSPGTAATTGVGAYQIQAGGTFVVNSGEADEIDVESLTSDGGTVNWSYGSNDYSLTFVTGGEITVTKRLLTVQAVDGSGAIADKVYDGTTAAAFAFAQQPQFALGNFANDDIGTAIVSNMTAAFEDRHVGEDKRVTVTVEGLDLNMTLGDAANYVLPDQEASTYNYAANITPRPISISATVQDKVYDGSTEASGTVIGASSTSAPGIGTSGYILGDDLGYSYSHGSAAFSDRNVGEGKQVTVTGIALNGDHAGNYMLVSDTATGTANITRLDTVTWTGGGGTNNWFDPANWADGAIPDLANVAKVIIPTGITVSFDTTGATGGAQTGAVEIDSLGAAGGGLAQADGTLNVGDGGITLGSLAQSGGTLTSSGSITLDSFAQTGGSTTTTDGAHFTVNTSFSQGTNGSLAVDGNAYITDDTDGLTLGNLVVGGSLAVDSNGDIAQADGTTITANGDSSFTADGDIDLSNDGNQFAGPVSLDSDNVSIASDSDLTLGNVIVDGNLTVDSEGNIAQADGTTITANGDSSSFTADGDIDLSNDGNQFAGTVNLDGDNVSIASDSDLTLGNVLTNGDLAVASNGDIDQADGTTITANGDSSFTADGNIDLSNDGNQFVGPVNLDGDNVSIASESDLTLGNVVADGNLAVDSEGDIAQAAGTTIDAGGDSSFTADGDIALTNDGNQFAGPVNLDGDNVSIASESDLTLGNVIADGSLAVASEGDIAQAAGTTITANGDSSFSADGDIDLSNDGNQFAGPVNLDGNNVGIASDSDLTLGNVVADGNLAVASNGDIAQADGTTIDANGDSSFTADGNIDLSNGNNDFAGTFTTNGHNITVTDGHDGLSIGDIVASGDLTVTSTDGSIIQIAPSSISVGGFAEFQARGGNAFVTLLAAGNTFTGGISIDDSRPAPVLMPPSPAPSLPTQENLPPEIGIEGATGSALSEASPGDTSAVSDDGSSLRMVLVREASTETSGLLAVYLSPEQKIAGSFNFMLPEQLTQGLPANVEISVTLADGSPLPSWLRFIPAARMFIAENVPANALPIKLSILVNGHRTIIEIS